MKKILAAILFSLLFVVSAFATQLTVNATTVNNWTFGGSTATIRLYATKTFVTSTGTTVLAGTTSGFYKTISCTVSGTTLNCLSSTIDSTTNASVPTAKFVADLYDQNGRARTRFFEAFSVPTTLGTTITWEQLRVYNSGTQATLPNTYLTAAQTTNLIGTKQDALVSGTTIKTINGSSVLGSGNLTISGSIIETNLAAASDLDTLITTAGANPTNRYHAILSAGITVSAAKVVPANVFIEPKNGSKFTKSGSGTITFQGPGLTDGIPAVVLFSGFTPGNVTWSAALPSVMRPEWFGAVRDGVTDDLTAFSHFYWVSASTIQRTAYIQLSPGNYVLSNTLEMDAPFVMDGMNLQAALWFPRNTTGIVVHAQATKDTSNFVRNATDSKIIGVRLKGSEAILDAGGLSTHTVNVSGLTVTKTSGVDFTGANGISSTMTITVGSKTYTVQSVDSATQVTLYKLPLMVFGTFGLDFVDRNVGDPWPTDGSWAGQTITFGGQTKTITAITADKITFSTPYTGITGSAMGNAVVVTAITPAADTFTKVAHGLATGQQVQIFDVSGTAPAPLVRSTYYYIIKVDNDTFKLATTYANALANTPINITTSGGGGPFLYTVYGYVGEVTLDSLATQTGVAARFNRFHGILLKTQAEIRDAYVESFAGNCYSLDSFGGVSGLPSSTPNLNRASLLNSRAYFCKGHGVWTKGTNANQLHIRGNLFGANQGAGVFEAGFLGNQYSSNLTEGNQFGSVYVQQTGANASSFFGEYMEGDQPRAVGDSRTTIWGGNMSSSTNRASAGGILYSYGGGLIANSLTVRRATEGWDSLPGMTGETPSWMACIACSNLPQTMFAFGSSDETGANSAFGADTPNYPAYQLRYGISATGLYSWQYKTTSGSSGETSVLAMSGEKAADGAAQLYFPNGFRTGVGDARVQRIFSGTASLDFTALAANSCEELTITVTGAADGDVVSLGVPNALASVAGATITGYVSAANTVKVRRCNVTTSATSDPAAATVRAQVTHF
jgi:hypothetical protein